MQRILKVNRHSAHVVSTLTHKEFLNEKEIQEKKTSELSKFGDAEKTQIIDTKTYIYLYVPKSVIYKN